MNKLSDDDLIGRLSDAENIKNFLNNRINSLRDAGEVGTFALNLDAEWGAGKSFFLKGFEEYLSTEDGGKHLTVQINAWDDDYSDDPLPYITSSLIDAVESKLNENSDRGELVNGIKSNVTKILISGGKGALKQLLTKAFGDDAYGEIVEAAGGAVVDQTADFLNDLAFQQEAIRDFKEQLAELSKTVEEAEGFNGPIYVLIDELDRCRPDYSVLFLERIKHFFSQDGYVFVVATDTTQLCHAINGVYGEQFDSKRYIKRFFNRPYLLRAPDINEYCDMLFDKNHIEDSAFTSPFIDSPKAFLKECFTQSNVGLRDIEQITDSLGYCIDLWPHEAQLCLPLLLSEISKFHFQTIDDEKFKDVSFSFTSYRNRRSRNTKITMREICERFKGIDQLGFLTPGNSRSEDGLPYYVDRVKHLEIRARGIQFNDEVENLVSLMSKYPELVRAFGKIT